jgi:F-box/leucine-rich repeat protein 10/11
LGENNFERSGSQTGSPYTLFCNIPQTRRLLLRFLILQKNFFFHFNRYALDKYVYALIGRTHLELSEDKQLKLLGSWEERQQYLESISQHHRHITPQELFGLKAIIMYIHALAVSKKNVPPLIKEPINLVRDVRLVVETHKDDNPCKAVTGHPLLNWAGIKDDKGYAKIKITKASKKKASDGYFYSPLKEGSYKPEKPVRLPCKICQACISPDCTKCDFCIDMVRYGGPGNLRRSCLLRTCLQPLLPLQVTCNKCNLDGWYADTNMRLVE